MSLTCETRFQEMVRRHRLECAGADTVCLPAVKVTHFNLKRLGYTFYDEAFDVSFWGIAALSFVVGIVGGIYGIGGGACLPELSNGCWPASYALPRRSTSRHFSAIEGRGHPLYEKSPPARLTCNQNSNQFTLLNRMVVP